MVDIHRYHEISESTHRLMNPMSVEKLMGLGDACQLREGARHLDLACGKGEMLCQFALRYGTVGFGADNYSPLLHIARLRATELGVIDQLSFVEADASEQLDVDGTFDVVSCIGATWIGGGLEGTLGLMKGYAAPRAWLLVGEAYWATTPTEAIARRYGGPETFRDLAGTLVRFEAAGTELVLFASSSPDEWDAYASSQWLNIDLWLDENADDPIAADLRKERNANRRQYLAEERGVLSWGVFVLRAP